jgi:hypothetical protein
MDVDLGLFLVCEILPFTMQQRKVTASESQVDLSTVHSEELVMKTLPVIPICVDFIIIHAREKGPPMFQI